MAAILAAAGLTELVEVGSVGLAEYAATGAVSAGTLEAGGAAIGSYGAAAETPTGLSVVNSTLFPGIARLGESLGEGFQASALHGELVAAGGSLGPIAAGIFRGMISTLPTTALVAMERAGASAVEDYIRGLDPFRTPDRPAVPDPGGDVGPRPPEVDLFPTDNVGTDIRHKLFFTLSNYTSTQVTRMPNAFPKSIRRKLRWNSLNRIDHTNIHEAQGYAIKLNNVVNPGIHQAVFGGTIDDHEPMGFAQYAAIYDQHVVHGATIRVDYHNGSLANDGPTSVDAWIVGLALKDDITRIQPVSQYEELDGTVFRLTGAEETGSLYMSVDCVKYFGIPKKQALSDPSIRVLNATAHGLTNELFLHIFMHQAIPGDLTTETFVFNVTIEYDVTFMEPKDVALANVV